MISISARPVLPLRGTSNARGNQKLLLTSSIVLLSAVIPVQPAHASTDGKSQTSVEGWYPAERMCELDMRDVAQGRQWACTRSADRSGWELRITTRNGEPR